MHKNDKEIIECIKSGKESRMLEQLYDRIFPKIRKYIRKNSGSEDDAFDVFQDGVVILCNHIITGKYREDNEIAGFLYTVCRNLWINKTKHEQMLVRLSDTHEPPDGYTNILDNLVTRERENEVKMLMAELGERCRELLQYVFYYEMNTREICEKMGFANEDTLKTKKYKCKQRLLEIMSKSRN